MFRDVTACVCVLALVSPAMAQQRAETDPRFRIDEPQGGLARLTRNYRAKDVAAVRLANSGRMEKLLRAGNLYLSLNDAIALALENNLDIEVQRYGPQIAEASIERAKAGGFARGVGTNVTRGPQSARGQNAATFGIQGNASSEVSSGGQTGGAFITQTGSTIPNLDPTFQSRISWGHFTTPQSNAFVLGTNAFIQEQTQSAFSVSKGFLTGTNVSLSLNNNGVTNNNRSADFNPNTTSSLGVTVTQRLLQGWGVAVNNRQIRIARNNREVSELVFKQQVIETVSNISNLYWDLVSFNEDVRVRKQALALAEKLLGDNKKQVEIGTMAPIEIVRAEAEVARAQQELTLSETQVLQQETILKNQLSRIGVASPALTDARIVTTDRIRIPETEAIAPIQDMMAQAISGRPELAQRRIQLQNSKISIEGSKSALRPTLDAFATFENNGLAGGISTLPVIPGRTRVNDPFFVGGWGTAFSQVLRRNFPDYSVGVQMNIPLRNRQAQADYLTDQLQLRQSELQLQSVENSVRVQVQNALIGLQQARARYQAAVKNRILQEQTLDAEQKKLALGASTPYNVIQVQRDLAQAQSSEVSALSNYANARTELDRATGQTLVTNNVSMDEVYRGEVSRAPSAIPVLDQR